MTNSKPCLLTLALTSACLWTVAASAQQEQRIVPHGWSMRVSSNSVYLTRPDLPYIQIAMIDDVRSGTTPEAKFESGKAFFAERAKCPGLAKAETGKSFAGYFAADDADWPRCQLIGMGHWVKGGLQMALILNSAPKVGPRSGSYTRQAITQDVVELFTMRFQIAQSGQSPIFSAQGYATLVPIKNKPVAMIQLIDASAKYRAVLNGSSGKIGMDGQVGDPEFPFILLFPEDDASGLSWASHCLAWDPAMLTPDWVPSIKTAKKCSDFIWRWKDQIENGQIEAREVGSKDWLPLDSFEGSFKEVSGFYRPFGKGLPLDIKLGKDITVLTKVANGSLPASALARNDIVFTPDGRFMAGELRSRTLEGGKSAGAVSGQYSFDRYTMTLLLDGGRVVHGFAGWLPSTSQRTGTAPTSQSDMGRLTAVNINGWLYFTKCPQGLLCY